MIHRRSADSTSADALQLEVSIPFGLAGQSAPALARAARGYTERVTERQRSRLAAEQTLHDARLEVLGGAEALAVAQRRQFRGSGLHYWMTAVIACGHLD